MFTFYTARSAIRRRYCACSAGEHHFIIIHCHLMTMAAINSIWFGFRALFTISPHTKYACYGIQHCLLMHQLLVPLYLYDPLRFLSLRIYWFWFVSRSLRHDQLAPNLGIFPLPHANVLRVSDVFVHTVRKCFFALKRTRTHIHIHVYGSAARQHFQPSAIRYPVEWIVWVNGAQPDI